MLKPFPKIVVCLIVLLAGLPLYSLLINGKGVPELAVPGLPGVFHADGEAASEVAASAMNIPLSRAIRAGLTALALKLSMTRADGSVMPVFFYAVSLILHGVATLLAFFIIRRLLNRTDEDGWGPAILGAAVFAWHPVQVEAVAWAAEFSVLLAAVFAFWAILLEISRVPAEKEKPAAFPLVLFLLALLSKPTAIAVPLILLVINHIFLKMNFFANMRRVWPYLVISVPAALVFISVHGQGPVQSSVEPWVPPLVALDSLWFYLSKLFYPVDLAVDYGRNPIYLLNRWWFFITWLGPVGLLALLLVTVRRGRIALGCYAVLIAGVLPVLGLVPFAFQVVSTVADRFMYLAMLGPALAAALLARRLPKRIMVSAGSILVVALVAGSNLQARTWKDEAAVMRRAETVNPRSYVARHHLAGLEKFGSPAQLKLYWEAVRRKPDYIQALAGLAMTAREIVALNGADVLASLTVGSHDRAVYWVKRGRESWGEGDFKWTLNDFGQAVRYETTNPEPYNGSGVTLMSRRYYREAEAMFAMAAELSPHRADYLNNLAVAEFFNEKQNVARGHFRRALDMAPGDSVIRVNCERLRTFFDAPDKSVAEVVLETTL